MNLFLSQDEQDAIAEMAKTYECSEQQIVHSALRLYHQHYHRRLDGETCTWSGDAARAAEKLGLDNQVAL